MQLPSRPLATPPKHAYPSCRITAGTKRSRPGTPRITPGHPHSPRDEFDSGFEDSDSNSDGESCCGDDRVVTQSLVLSKQHRFHQARRPLLRLARQRVEAFADSTHYVAPPDQKAPPRKRSRSSSWQPEASSPFQEFGSHSDKEGTDNGFVVISPSKNTECFHFSCPFYARRPKQYQQCLIHHDLLTMENVITHIQRHHKQPHYCPKCSQMFDSVIDCDRHIMARTCRLRDLIIPDGINLYQKERLAKMGRRQLSNAERWDRVKATVFPDAVSLPSPYLDQGCGRAVSTARDYWHEHGWRFISGFLSSEGLLDNDDRAQVALFKLTLGDLVAEIINEDERARRAREVRRRPMCRVVAMSTAKWSLPWISSSPTDHSDTHHICYPQRVGGCDPRSLVVSHQPQRYYQKR